MLRTSVPYALVCLLLVSGAGLVGAEEKAAPVKLSAVEGGKHFPGGAEARALLERQGFVVLPRFHKQIFEPYIGGRLPYYVTTDSAHRTYHVIFEEVLKALEQSQAAVWRTRLARLYGCVAALEAPAGAKGKAGRTHALAMLAVAARLLDPMANLVVPDAARAAVRSELELVAGAAGIAQSPLRRMPEDYAQYKPRGLYEGDPTLEAWFRAAQWLGRTGFRMRNELETLAACLIVRAIQADEVLRKAFGFGADVYGWLLGPPDDLTVEEYAPVVKGVDFAKDLGLVRMRLASLRDPEINDQMLEPSAWRRFRQETKGLRLFPKRRTPDGWLAQELVMALPGRSLVGGLEVAASLGSLRAARHLSSDPAMPALGRELGKREQGFVERLESTHYGATLKAQAQLFDETTPLYGKADAVKGAKGLPRMDAPVFGGPAWGDRLLSTGLAGWASLRHAWVLHAKSAAYLLSRAGEQPGVVEPAPAYYAALAALARSLGKHKSVATAFGGGDPRALAKRLAPLLKRLGALEQPSEADMSWLSGLGTRLERVYAEQPEGDAQGKFKRMAARLEAYLAGNGELTEAETALLGTGGAERVGKHLTAFADLMDGLVEIAKQQLAGKPLTSEQEQVIETYGETIAGLQFFDGNSYMSPQWQMGLVADVGSDPQSMLTRHAAVGAPMDIYVVLPLHGGGHRLYRGGVYSYYEFDHMAPVTDSEWRRQVSLRQTPSLPPWTSSYITSPGVQVFVEQIRRGESPAEIEDLNDGRIAEALLAELGRAPESRKDDRHLAWVAESLVRYGEGERYRVVRDALISQLLLRANALASEKLERSFRAAAMAVGQVLKPEDHELLVALLLQPPEGSSVSARGRLKQALLATRHASLPKTAGRLMRATSPEVRSAGIEILASPYEYRDKGGPAAVAAALAALLENEQVADVQALALTWLAQIAKNQEARRAGAPAAPVAVRLIASESQAVRIQAANVLGALRFREAAPALLAALQGEPVRNRDVVCALSEALGGALHHSSAPDVSDDVAKRSVAALSAGTRSEEWYISLASMKGLSLIQSDTAIAAIAAVATDTQRGTGARGMAIRCLGESGAGALPHLFRMLFDETKTGDSINDHDCRLCDDAAEALFEATEGKLGWRWGPPGDEEEREAQLAALRAEAKKRGYAR